MTIVLDTCALIWWSLEPEKLSEAARQSCEKMEKEQSGLVSSISIWELAIKIKNKKLDLGVELETYVAALKKSSAVRIVPVDTDVWVESVMLDWTHRDPADRVVVALANSQQGSIITADKEIMRFCPNVVW